MSNHKGNRISELEPTHIVRLADSVNNAVIHPDRNPTINVDSLTTNKHRHKSNTSDEDHTQFVHVCIHIKKFHWQMKKPVSSTF